MHDSISDVRYSLMFDIPAASDQPIAATAEIRFKVSETGHPVVLDFAQGAEPLPRLTIGGKSSNARVVNNHIVIPAEEIQAGENSRRRSCFAPAMPRSTAIPDFLYTLFVPARAHLTFPCFDQPDLKAKYSLDAADSG